jgi:2-dehydropantoate 2-reductase
MHFLIIGAGAMGCLFAARLKRAGFEVTLVERIAEWAREIHEKGIRVEGVTGDYSVRVPTFSEPPTETPDAALICVKAYDTREAGEGIRSRLHPGAPVVTLQNGLGNVESLEEIFGKGRVLGGITAEGATVLGPGRIRHAGQGETLIGPATEPEGAAPRIATAFKQAGFKARAVESVEGLIWGKLIVNVGINALTALTRLKNGRLPQVPGTRRVLEDAVAEAVVVARAKGVVLPYPDPLARVLEVCEATAGNIASMLQDVRNRKVTEIGVINGAVVREGEALGIPTPVNRTLTRLVEAIQETYGERL